jgi:hypothetical protein
MTDYLTFEQARDALRKATKIVLEAEGVYGAAIEDAADAEGFYRTELGRKFSGYREAGKAVGEAETLARADVAVHSRERDATAGRVKLAAEKLEDARDSRRSLWRLIEWSARKDAANGSGEESTKGVW